MFKKAGIAVGAAVAAVSVGMLLLGTAFASGPGPKSDTAVGGRDIPLVVASDLTGLTQDELLAELQGGTTIPALLEEKGVDLNVFEQSHSIRSLADIYGYTHEEIAKKIGKSRVTVTELIRITDLPEEIREKCLTLGIARCN